MAAKWQQWMPFKIDAFKGSPAVQSMHPCARIGYLYLLACAWQTEDCTIPSDADELAEKSGLGEKLWETYGPRILKKFESVNGNGRLRNNVCYQQWTEAKRIFDRRKDAADRTNTNRWAIGYRSVTDGRASRFANTRTGTETVTEVQEPSRGKREQPTKTKIADERHSAFKEAIGKYWLSKNPSLEMPWGAPEGKQLGMWLREAPHITLDQFTGFLRNRFKSEVNHGERPSQWIRWITSYGAGPMDRFGKTIGGSHGQGNGFSNGHRSKTSGNFDEARAALVALAGQEPDSSGYSETGECIEGHVDHLRE